MNSVGNNFTTDLLLLRPPFINPKPKFMNPKFPNSITLTKPSNPRRITCCSTPNTSSSSSSTASVTEVDMVKNSQGIWSAKRKRVVVLWDLDNKPPHGPPYQAAMALKKVALTFGDIVEIFAYANRHAFIHLPHWVRQERNERRELDILERKGVSIPTDPYVCGVCGRKCRTNIDLRKHFKQLHERERQKKLSRMRSLKGKKRQKFKERFVSGNHKYEEAARSLIKPKVGYGLAAELRRAGVFVKEVEDKPQAADWAVKRQMQHSMNSGIDWLFLVSDDSDFSEMLKRAQGSSLGTVVIGDSHRALGPHADFWVPWNGVENGEIGRTLPVTSVNCTRMYTENANNTPSCYLFCSWLALQILYLLQLMHTLAGLVNFDPPGGLVVHLVVSLMRNMQVSYFKIGFRIPDKITRQTATRLTSEFAVH
ncbi:hypothetical protein C5167_010604 [Papaver somniferum]|uniref:C2H2-type domain-containing protein n=1 Tax=Papaver somniferum TaxID=3469 RepID=A0A4Y7K0P7_PAPSO|nr:hypothetical protein C5167_010604 [Papaver somniferum]